MSNNGEYVDITNTSNYNINSNYITIANLNPFRYRGYYYDTETGLYYLNTRYYDSELGRFINADDISILNELQEELNGLNLYTYCFNNPVNDIDELGSWSWKKFWKIVGKYVATIVVVGLVTAAIALTVGAIAMAIGGVALANSIVLPTIAGGLVAAGMSYIGQGVSNGFDNINLGTIAIDTFTGSAYGAIAGAFGGSPFLSDKILATLGNTLISGIASALHGLNGNKSREEIFNDMKLSIAYSLVYQTATIGIPLLFNFSNKTNIGKNILIDLYNRLSNNPTVKIVISRLLTGVFAILTNKYKR